MKMCVCFISALHCHCSALGPALPVLSYAVWMILRQAGGKLCLEQQLLFVAMSWTAEALGCVGVWGAGLWQRVATGEIKWSSC